MQAMDISLSGLDVEWRRLEVIANNIANLNTTRTATGGVFQPGRLVSGPKANFGEYLNAQASQEPVGVAVYSVETSTAAGRRVHDPSHPHADQDGFVSYPAVDQAQEMSNLIKTSRFYEANMVALNSARQMYAKALELGRR